MLSHVKMLTAVVSLLLNLANRGHDMANTLLVLVLAIAVYSPDLAAYAPLDSVLVAMRRLLFLW